MKTLRLNLKKEWYDMIESGVKTEEYREIKPYWLARLLTVDGTKMDKCYWELMDKRSLSEAIRSKWYVGDFIKYDYVTFVYGYTKRTMTFKMDSISFGIGNKEWGAPNDMVFIIKLGERVETD